MIFILVREQLRSQARYAYNARASDGKNPAALKRKANRAGVPV